MLRASRADSACDTAHTEPMSSAMTAYTAATRSTVIPPEAIAHPVKGSVSARATRPTPQPATSLPRAISSGRSRVTCSVASVPRSRSPLMT